MKRLLAVLFLLFLVGCQSGSSGHSSFTPTLQNGGDPVTNTGKSSVSLKLTAEQLGSEWLLELSAPNAVDLYQIAGTLAYDQDKYEITLVEPGGGLGSEDTTYFVSGDTEPGNMGFAYTKKYYGAGASGNVNLVSFQVTANDIFNLSDFNISTEDDELVVRDSHKEAFVTHLVKEVL